MIGLATLGLTDDITGHVSARVRFVVQLLAGSTLFANRPPDQVFAAPITAGIVNAVNFMDGINGITGMTATIWGVNIMLMEDARNTSLTSLGSLTAGAALGFLPYNAGNARMFLGDTGSYAFGAAMAAGILGQKTVRDKYRAGAPLVLYAADVAQALVQRARSRKPIGQPHRDHLYQRLVDEANFSHFGAALLHAGLATLITIASRFSGPGAILVTAGATAGYLLSPRPFTNAPSRQATRAEQGIA